MKDFTKIVRIGTQPKLRSTFCKITLEAGRLSITGVEGPLPSGNAMGSCGQIVLHLIPSNFSNFAPGWDAPKLKKFLAIWKKWHLNDTQAGTPAQMAELEKHVYEGFEWAKTTLKAAGLEPDQGYSYGTAWRTIEVPEDVLKWLRALPDTDKAPAWA